MGVVLNRVWTHLGILTIFLILSLLFLWPLPLTGTTELVGGGGDPLLELWTLSWNAHWLSGGALSYFDANICHPEKNSLAFADHLFSQSLFFTPLFKATGNPVLGYNLLLVMSLALSGWGTCLCARSLGLSPPVSLLAGILFAFFPFRTAEVNHLHILSTQWLPFSFYFLLHFLRADRFRPVALILFTLFSTLHLLCSFYQALIWALLTGITILAFLPGRRFTLRRLAGLAGAGLVLSAAIFPFASACFEVSRHYGIVRSIEENHRYSAKPKDFLSLPHNSLLHRTMAGTESPRARDGEHTLYPGLIFTILLGFGVAAALRTRSDLRRVWLMLLVTVAAAAVFSFGPVLITGSAEHQRFFPLPYALLYHLVPGIKGLRVPSRLVILLHFSGALLAGLGLQGLLGGRRTLTRGITWAAVLLLSSIAFLESASFDLPTITLPVPGSMPPAYRDIRRLPEDTVLLELPTHTPQFQFLPMYFSTFHFHPLANGRSGIIPPVTRQMHRVTDPYFPHGLGPALLDHMFETGINTVLLHRHWNSKKRNQAFLNRLADLNALETVGRYDDFDILYRLSAVPGLGEDITLLPAGSIERAEGPPIRLTASDAFPSTLNRQVAMTVEDEKLRIGEQMHFRWLTHIPAGRWQLRMVLSGLVRPANEGRPCSVLAEVAGVTVIDRDDVHSRELLSGIPIQVERSAHYRISCLVRPEIKHTSINVVLGKARLTPISVSEPTDLEENP